MYRNKEIKIRLTEKELQQLDRNVAKAAMSREGYIRTLISGYEPQTAPSQEYWDNVRILWNIAQELQHIAPAAGMLNSTLENRITDVYSQLSKVAADFQSVNIPKKHNALKPSV